MNKKFTSILTKIFLFIVLMVVIPSNSYSQKGKSVKSEGKTVKSKRTKGSYNAQKRSKKKSWNNQNKATRKRMKFAAKNARRRQKGKPMKSNRLTLKEVSPIKYKLLN